MIKKLIWTLVILATLVSLACGAALYWLIVVHPGDEIKPENINAILGKESPVFYNDGKTPLGVFFDEAHRQYVPYKEIPVNFINALVASEDNRFFYHFGFDVMGILRATIKNIQSGRIVQGGSTLTQQTAKNLFKRESRSYQAKLKELLFALRLEYHYSKEKIFEFYANQFYVSGNGHGLGVAARYYFDKKPEELSLLECAYIAGSVKRPNYYNPFTKKSEESSKMAAQRGRQRVNYVLAKMLELGMISEYQHSLARVSEVEFNNGQVGYSLDYVMEMVKDAVTSSEITEALELNDIDNIATSGVRIITTVNKNLQEATLYALRHDLSRLDVRLRGYERDEVQAELQGLDYAGDSDVREGAFVFGTVKSVAADTDASMVEVDLGRKTGTGIIDRAGFERLVDARVKWQKNPWSETKKADYNRLLDQLLQGDKVWVSVRKIEKDGSILLDLEKFPKVNGGALVYKDGRILAMAGGVENRFYNRAIYAKRTMGSSFKPFVFAAALQLGWNSADHLRNSRDVFIYQNQAYFPRPDHVSPYEEVSMSWAGVHSENVASVWLLANLCGKLDSAQFREVAAHVGLAPRVVDGEEEPYSRFRSRIRDSQGIVINLDLLRKAAYQKAVKNIETDLLFVGREEDFSRLSGLHYGLGFKNFEEEIINELNDSSKKLSSSKRKELQLRLTILKNNYLDLETLRSDFNDYKQAVRSYDPFSPSPFFSDGTGRGSSQKSGFYYDQYARKYSFIDKSQGIEGLAPVSPAKLKAYLESLEESKRQEFWNNVYLGNDVSIEAFDVLQNQVNREMADLKEQLPYSMDVLENISDYRILVGLRFLIAFARELGVNSELEPVLSFPLGSNVVTLLETLRVYETLATGEMTATGKIRDGNEDLLSIIDKIESDKGEVIYQPQRLKRRILSPQTSVVIGHILENIVKFGTGRYADTHVKLQEKNEEGDPDPLKSLGLSIPLLGKTGTANRYTNASFFGFLPLLAESRDSLTMDDGYAVGVYVGYDDNKEMRKGATKISGSAGALPAWSEIVKSIALEEEYASHLDPVDLSFYGLSLKRANVGQKNIEAATDQGGIIVGKGKEIDVLDRYHPSIVTFGNYSQEGFFEPEQMFLPFWKYLPNNTSEKNDKQQ